MVINILNLFTTVQDLEIGLMSDEKQNPRGKIKQWEAKKKKVYTKIFKTF